jgi:low affinity Fe/Cu permease
VAVTATIVVVCSVAIGAGLGFPTKWVSTFEVSVSAVTLIMVFAIQHTQAREQAATQRKLDELIRALPGASEKLMMLEEAPKEVMQEVEEDQRDLRSELMEERSAD